MSGQAKQRPPGRTPGPRRLTASHWDAVATNTRLYFRQHDRQKNRWEARIEIPRHRCPREDLRLQFGGVRCPSQKYPGLKNELKTYKIIPEKHTKIRLIRKNKTKKERTCVTSETMIKKTSGVLSALRRSRPPPHHPHCEGRLDIRSHWSQRLQARFVHTAINRTGGGGTQTSAASGTAVCTLPRGRGRTATKLCLDASSAVENKRLSLCPASKMVA